MDRIGAPDRACANSIRLAPSFVLRGKSGTPEVAMALVLVMILAALIALIVVTAGLVIVQRRSDRRRGKTEG
jgi:hypothetical protein